MTETDETAIFSAFKQCGNNIDFYKLYIATLFYASGRGISSIS